MATNAKRLSAYEIIGLILNAQTISEEEKQRYIGSIEAGEYPEEMQKELAQVFYAEMKLREEQIAGKDAEIAELDSQMAAEWQKAQPEAEQLVADHAEELDQIMAEHEAGCDKIEREADSSVEGAVREDEQSQADAIREQLKGGE